jgi:hypothetical protein
VCLICPRLVCIICHRFVCISCHRFVCIICRLGNCTFGKLPLGKLPLGNIPLWSWIGKCLWESTWHEYYCLIRISTVAGYLPSDVHGCSAFNFMLGEDLPWTTLALRSSKDYDKDDFWNKLFVKNLLERS